MEDQRYNKASFLSIKGREEMTLSLMLSLIENCFHQKAISCGDGELGNMKWDEEIKETLHAKKT